MKMKHVCNTYFEQIHNAAKFVLFALAVVFFVMNARPALAGTCVKIEDPKNEEMRENVRLGVEKAEHIYGTRIIAPARSKLKKIIKIVNPLIAINDLTPFEKSALLRLRGHANFGLNDYAAVIKDWREAVELGGLLSADLERICPDLGIVMGAKEQPIKGANWIESWLAAGGAANDPAAQLKYAKYLAAVFGGAEEYQKALPHAERAYALMGTDEKLKYTVIEFLYAMLDMPEETLELMEEKALASPNDKAMPIRIEQLKEQMRGKPKQPKPFRRKAPQYPYAAENTGLEGSCAIYFDVDEKGRTKNISADCSDPVFVKPATKAISKWKYHPKIENDIAVEQLGFKNALYFWLER